MGGIIILSIVVMIFLLLKSSGKVDSYLDTDFKKIYHLLHESSRMVPEREKEGLNKNFKQASILLRAYINAEIGIGKFNSIRKGNSKIFNETFLLIGDIGICIIRKNGVILSTGDLEIGSIKDVYMYSDNIIICGENGFSRLGEDCILYNTKKIGKHIEFEDENLEECNVWVDGFNIIFDLECGEVKNRKIFGNTIPAEEAILHDKKIIGNKITYKLSQWDDESIYEDLKTELIFKEYKKKISIYKNLSYIIYRKYGNK